MRKNGLDVQDTLDITEVFFAFAFSVKNHFPEDNIFGWCDIDRAERCLLGESVLPGPCEGGISIARVEVCFEPCRDMDDIEVAPAVAGNFGGDHIGRRTIIRGFLKTGYERGDVFKTYKQRDINIECEPRFAIVHRTDRSGDNVAEASIVDGTNK